MNCIKCGIKLKGKDKYCVDCGNLIDMNRQDIEIKAENNQYNNLHFDKKFIKAYIGKGADEMYYNVRDSGINMWAIVLGIGYYAYRKMYLISIFLIILSYILISLMPSFWCEICITIGALFCPIYKWDITRKLRKIKKDNPNTDENKLLSIAKNKGGTSLLGGIVFTVIYFFIILLLLFI